MLADAPDIDETRVLEWNTTVEDRDTVLFAVRGDASTFAAAAPDTTGIHSVRLSAPADCWTYALVEMDALSTPVFEAIRRARTRSGLVVRKPIVYRDAAMRFRVVGDPGALQAALDDAPDALAVDVAEIETLRGDPGASEAALSDRQRAALVAAHDLGYYERPREATHDDVATALDCAPSTASHHLRTAEAKVVDAALTEFGSAG
jgi:predicted DNA binding protein